MLYEVITDVQNDELGLGAQDLFEERLEGAGRAELADLTDEGHEQDVIPDGDDRQSERVEQGILRLDQARLLLPLAHGALGAIEALLQDGLGESYNFV